MFAQRNETRLSDPLFAEVGDQVRALSGGGSAGALVELRAVQFPADTGKGSVIVYQFISMRIRVWSVKLHGLIFHIRIRLLSALLTRVKMTAENERHRMSAAMEASGPNGPPVQICMSFELGTLRATEFSAW